jgi:hypothetical protein
MAAARQQAHVQEGWVGEGGGVMQVSGQACEAPGAP